MPTLSRGRCRLGAAAAIVVAAFLLAPEAAEACSVCALSTVKNRVAYIATWALLSATPAIYVGGLIWWWRRRIREGGQEG